MGKKWILLVLLIVLPVASAFDIEFTNINNSIFKDETAAFAMEIVNTRGFEDTFSVSTRDPDWVLTTKPPLTSIDPLSSKSFVLYLKPKQGVELGPHAVPVKTRSVKTGQFREDNILVNIKPRTPFGGEYAPSVGLNLFMETPVDPRNNLPMSIQLDNKNPRDMPELLIVVDGEVFHKEETVHLNPLEKKTREFLFQIDPRVEQGIYNLRVSLVEENITIAEVSREYEVIEYSEVKEDVESESYFFRTTTVFRLTNNGNVRDVIRKRVQVPWWNRLFVSFEPEPEVVREGGERYYQWDEELDPAGMMSVRMVENYRIPVLILIAAALATLAYFIFRSPVVVRKTAIGLEGSGEKTMIKIRLEVRNRSGKSMHDVTVLDKIPSMADFVKKMEPGTMKPEKVVASSSKGTSVRWEMEELEPYEERLITYNIKCKLKIVGGMKLPPSKIKFSSEKGKERSVLSNRANVMAQGEL